MRITSKGQVTIPKDVRDKAGIDQKTELDVSYRDGVIVIRKAGATDAARLKKSREFGDWLDKVKGSADTGLSADDILNETRGPFDDLDAH